jgi:UDP-N-acetylmuramyl pentapeptide phosphotransferase/UDP-N-acetylglucosamine-1-phosphate transferase
LLILPSVFIADATSAAIRRKLSGEKWYEAHRTHVFKLANQVGYYHKGVTVRVTLINLCLAVIALVATTLRAFPVRSVLLYTGHCFFSIGVL